MNRFIFMIVVLFAILVIGFSERTDAVAADSGVTSIPVPAPFAPALNSNGTAKYIGPRQIENLFKTQSRNLRAFLHNRKIKHYIVPDRAWIGDLLGMYEAYKFQHHLRPEHDTWDCENYSVLLNSFASIRLWRAGYTNTRIAMGWMRVKANHSWAGIPDAVHALMFAVTDQGILVIEPQNGQTIDLAHYPNKATIEEVYLF